MKAFLEAGEQAWSRARNAERPASPRIPLAAVRLEAPIRNPGKVLAIGLNYADHVKESGAEKPKHQIWFNKQWNAITGRTRISRFLPPRRISSTTKASFAS
jgi:2-keto-4-pentenoate hydratase/2-oxohepta-3-ene-1,7-dioic acid hydratase in catechol pathway